jgi:hypothetical protein
MHHIGMRVYLTAVAMFVSSLLACATSSRIEGDTKFPPNKRNLLPQKVDGTVEVAGYHEAVNSR